MSTRDDAIARVIKVLRLARAAGTEAEAQTALVLAQRLMYAHDIAAGELEEPESVQPIDDAVLDAHGHHVPWKEYLAAIIAESFRCAYIISESRSTGVVRLVLVGRRADVAVATEAYLAGAAVAASLAEACAATRPEADREGARASFLTGFLKGLLDRLTENAASTALVVLADAEVVARAAAWTNGGAATGGALPTSDADALQDGLESGYLHGSGRRSIPGS